MSGPYVMAIRAADLFADPSYQRDADPKRVKAMAAEFDPRLLGVIDVSKRAGGRYAILDGQHRHALVTEVRGTDEPVVCQVYEGLTVQDESRLFHEINVRRKALNFWDRWKARRAAGDERVALIEQILDNHQLRVNPAAVDGHVMATAALEVIVDEIGDAELLDQVVTILLSAFGRSREAFQGPVLQGLAYVLANYKPDELAQDRLVRQLSEIPVRQLRARAQGLREVHKGTVSRLVGAVIVDQYNRGPGRKVEPFFSRALTTNAASQQRWRDRHKPAPVRPRPGPSSEPSQAPLPATRPPCRCGRPYSEHYGHELAPQCIHPGSTCLQYRPALDTHAERKPA